MFVHILLESREFTHPIVRDATNDDVRQRLSAIPDSATVQGLTMIKNEGGCMRQKRLFGVVAVLLGLMLLFSACGSKEEKKMPSSGGTGIQAPQASSPPLEGIPTPRLGPAGAVVEVDGAILTEKQLDRELKDKMAAMKGKIPAAKMEEARKGLRQRVIEDFVVRTLLTNEVKRRNIQLADREVNEAMEQLKASFPPGTTLETLMKKNKITREKLREEIVFGLKINKLVLSQPKAKEKPTEKEIQGFYRKNTDKFKSPESVRVRHILIAKAPADDAAAIRDKKNKADGVQKQLAAGGNFAELAKTNSDCPSKEAGGDLGTFTRGQMVKPFEDAAFSQKINAIGPVVETEYGYHVIQVLEKHPPKTMPLDAQAKEMISSYLQRQKQQATFNHLVRELRGKANVVLYQP